MKRVLVVVALLGTAGGPARAATCDSNLMIVLDRSCSMGNSPGGGEPRSKWEIAGQVLGQLTRDYASRLHFGLVMFPDQTGVDCMQDGPIYVGIASGSGSAVESAITGTQPTNPCVTDIDGGMAQVATDPAYAQAMPANDGRRGFVLLVTDGKQSSSCGGGARNATTEATIRDLYNKGYPTYVVGFGGEVDPTALGAFAMAGGVPRSGSPSYYQADTAADLQMAIAAIAGNIGGDEFGCNGTPCPDGRCFGTGEQCVSGHCTTSGGSGGSGGGGTGTGGGGGSGAGGAGGGAGNGVGGAGEGCGCALGGRPTSAAWALAVLALAAAAGYRGRRSRKR